jgi:methionine synthase I (cobalamin-dependent)
MVYKQTAEEFVADALTIAALGVNVIGGCCGTTPGFIARLSAALRHRTEEPAASREGTP